MKIDYISHSPLTHYTGRQKVPILAAIFDSIFAVYWKWGNVSGISSIHA